jgi:hypothetical protein
MSFRPPGWGQHCRAIGYLSHPDPEPVIIRVILKRGAPLGTTDLPRNYRSYFIVYEVRDPNRALVSIGLPDRLKEALSIVTERRTERAPSTGRAVPNTAGTLGGVLGGVDPRKSYLLTCAQVLGPPGTTVYHPGPYEGRHSEPIASVKHWKVPLVRNADDPCSEEATPDALRLDLAVAELSVGSDVLAQMGFVTTAKAVGAIEAIRKHDRVSFTGKTRGRINAKIGALTLWDEVEFADGVRCFGRIFEIKSPTRQYVREDLAQPGDSGSWLVFEHDDLVTWYGMVMACDGGQAYACFAEYILDECNGSGAFSGGLRFFD